MIDFTEYELKVFVADGTGVEFRLNEFACGNDGVSVEFELNVFDID
jgi:hypothetical protein